MDEQTQVKQTQVKTIQCASFSDEHECRDCNMKFECRIYKHFLQLGSEFATLYNDHSSLERDYYRIKDTLANIVSKMNH